MDCNFAGPVFLGKLEKMARDQDFEFLEWEHRTSAQVCFHDHRIDDLAL